MARQRRVAARKFIGIFDAGTRNVELYIRKGRDAEFHMQPCDRQAEIVIGTCLSWYEIVGNLVHEIAEFSFADMGLRFAPMPDISKDNGNYHFTMDHTHFSEAMARVGLFLSQALPALRKALPRVK
jgi:hypothetical protein